MINGVFARIFVIRV